MGSFGENLRREREMRGISLDEIASSTKISIRFLQAMENDEFASLPGGIFRRSFIRSYAKYLGLDEEQVIAEYQMTAQPKDVEISRLMFSSSYGPRPERRSFFLPVLLAVAMVAGAYALFHYAHRPEESPAAPPSGPPAETQTPQERSSPAPASDRGQTMGASAAPAESPSGSASLNTAGGSDAAQKQTSPGVSQSHQPGSAPGAAVNSDMVLQVAATQRVWVSVDADGKTALQRTLNPQDIRTIKARDHFDFMTGNAQGVVLTLNGEPLKPLGREGEVKKVHLTRSDVKPPPPQF